MNVNRNSSHYCLFCNGPGKDYFTVTSGFFSKRVFDRDPEVISIFTCTDCESKYFKISLTEGDLERLYSDYRGKQYYELRHAYEPWYTLKINNDLGSFSERQYVLLETLESCKIPNDFRSVLDHGGDKGQMISENGGIKAVHRYVYDLSGVDPVAGVETISEQSLPNFNFDLILSCHVLEHLVSPEDYLRKIINYGEPNTLFYFEVPNEKFSLPPVCSTPIYNRWLNIVCRYPNIMKFLDFVSTAARYKLGFIPVGGVVPLREHLQMFSKKGLIKLVENVGFHVIFCDIMSTGHIVLLARPKY